MLHSEIWPGGLSKDEYAKQLTAIEEAGKTSRRIGTP